MQPPICPIENDHFRHFLSVMDRKHDSVSVASTLDSLYERSCKAVKKKLKSVLKIDLTVDIWSDRRMRGFLGMTAHAIVIDDDHKLKLSSFLIGCDRFSGSHTGERISTALNEIKEKFNVINKIDCIITDNASNMHKAFNASFPVIEPVDNCNEVFVDNHASDVDENELWEDLPEIELDKINAMLDANCKRLRLSCYTHTQHLVVNDGLKDTKCVSSAVAKATSLSTLRHQSSSFRDLFDTTFGNNKGIPAAVSTRWNSTVWMLKAVIVLDIKQLILDTHGRKDFVFTHKEEAQLSELVDIL